MNVFECKSSSFLRFQCGIKNGALDTDDGMHFINHLVFLNPEIASICQSNHPKLNSVSKKIFLTKFPVNSITFDFILKKTPKANQPFCSFWGETVYRGISSCDIHEVDVEADYLFRLMLSELVLYFILYTILEFSISYEAKQGEKRVRREDAMDDMMKSVNEVIRASLVQFCFCFNEGI